MDSYFWQKTISYGSVRKNVLVSHAMARKRPQPKGILQTPWRALDNDKVRAQTALSMIQQLYAVERKAKEQRLDVETIKELRLTESLPVINELGKWIFEQIKSTLPKSQIGKALQYSYARWDALSAYLYDGSLLIDNNQIENPIRPQP